MLPTKYSISSENGFTINTNAYKDFLVENDLTTKITHLLGTIDYTDHKSIQRASKHIQKYITDSLLPKDLVAEIFRAYALLGGVLHDEKVTMALTNDTETITQKVKGEATLLVTLKELWAACFSPESLLDHQNNKQALLEKGSVITVETVDKKGTNQHSPSTEPKQITSIISSGPILQTATKVYVNDIKPNLADSLAKRQVDGVELLHGKQMVQTLSAHPKQLIRDGKGQEYVEMLADRIAAYAKPFSPRPVIYQTADLQTNDYHELPGGDAYEPEEANAAIGYRGAYRSLHDPEVFALELDAIKVVRNTMELKNVWLMLPFVRTVDELEQVKKRITEAGFYRSPNFKIWMTIEVPSNVVLLDRFIEAGIDGISIDIDDLTMLLLGIDHKNMELEKNLFEDDAVLWAIEKVIKTAHKYHIPSLLHTATSLQDKLLEKLIHWGITSVSVSPDALEPTRERIAEIEKRLMS